ncbi:MAG: hypothetical protein ACKO0N_00255 [Planctomycetota bacterium]
MDSEKSKPVEQRTFPEYCPRWLRFFSQIKRARKYVDRNVQGGLLTRMAIHWGVFFFTSAFAYIVVQAIVSPNGTSFLQRIQNSLTEFSLLGLLMLTLMPAFLLDVVRFSNRFAGPIVRLRRFLRELGENGEVPPLKFRDDDFWMEIAKEFNVCRERIYRQKMEIDRLQALLNEHSIDWSDWSPDRQSKTSSNVTV